MTRKFLAVLLLSAVGVGCTGEFSLDGMGPDTRTDQGTQPDSGVDMGADVSVPDLGGDAGGDAGWTQCETPEAVFQSKTWPEAGRMVCAGCHLAGGVAQNQGSTFLLKGEQSITSEGLTLDEFYAYNLGQFREHSDDVGGVPKFVSKALGVDHGGGAVAPMNSDAYQSLEALVTAFETEGSTECVEPPDIDPLADLLLMTPQETLRKATLQMAGRLPTQAELDQLEGLEEAEAMQALDGILMSVMQGQNFHEWLKYTWNEIFRFRGLWELDVTFDFMVVPQQDFGTRTWGFIGRNNLLCDTLWENEPVWDRFGYASIAECDNNLFGRDYMGDRVAWSLIEGPLELVAHIIESDRPFTEILTTETVMMNYYSSIVYFGSAKANNNPYVAQYMSEVDMDTVEHPAGSTLQSVTIPELHEFRPMNSMKRSRRFRPDPQVNEIFYEYHAAAEWPRAGLLTDQLYLTRYPTTDTNVNRHRTWAFFNQFLGVDILALADRRGDPAEAELGSDQPVIDDPNCNVCHNVMDPVAGLFQDFGIEARWLPNAQWPPRDQPPMLGPGISIIGPNPGAAYDPTQTNLAPLQWLGAQTIQDPRFASRMIRHAFLQVTGHEPMEPPTDLDSAGWRGRVKAYEVETQFINALRMGFVDNNYDMKWVYREIVKSPWYRAKNIATPEVIESPDRLAGISNFGEQDKLLTPFEMHRKIEAVLGRPWAKRAYAMRGNNLNVIDENAVENDFLLRFNSENDFRFIDSIYRDMYGGIDHFNNTSRLTLPSSVMAAVGRRVASEFACATVAQDFALQPRNRVFFGAVQADSSTDLNPTANRQTLIRLHERMLGVTPDEAQITAALALFDQVRTQGQTAIAEGRAVADLPPHCQALEIENGQQGAFTAISQDPTYSVRAWMAVVAYVAMDPEFIYRW